MARLIDQIGNSGLFAQSAISASIATNDSLGRNISTTYLTAHQDVSDKLDVTAFTSWSAAQEDSDYELSAGNGITLYDDSVNKITRIDVTAAGGDVEVNTYVQNNSAGIDNAISTYQSNSSTYITAHQDLSNYYTKSQTSGASELEQAFSDIVQDDTDVSTLVHSNSSTWNDVTNKLDKSESANYYPRTGNPSKFIPQSALNLKIDKISGIGGSAFSVGNHNAVTFPLSDGFGGIDIGNPYDNGYLKYLCTDHISEITLTTMPKVGNYKISANSAVYIIPGNSWITFYEQRNSEGQYRWTIKDYNGSGVLTSATSTTTGGGGGTGDMSTSLLEYNVDNQITGYNGTAFAGQGGGSVDTIPFVVNSPLVTGFTGTSAYLGLDSTAIDLSQYVPYSALGDDWDGRVHTINGSAIYSQYASDSQRANSDSNGDDITSTYQKISDMSNYQTSLTFAGSDNTLTAINGSAIGGTMESFELSGGNNISIIDDIVNSATIISVSGLSANEWNDTTNVVQTNSATWGAGSTPTYDYTDNNLISAIDTSGLYATSAGTANALINGGRLGTDVYAITGAGTNSITLMILNPQTTPFGNTSGIYSPLYYAQGACMTYGSSAGNIQYFGGFFKGNEWYVSNATAGQALRGETHLSRGVHISGATTAGTSFDLSINAVSGKNDTANGYNWKLERGCVSGKGIGGEWRYGPAEDTLLRSVSSNLPYPMEIVSTSSEATGTNILYVVTGAGA